MKTYVNSIFLFCGLLILVSCGSTKSLKTSSENITSPSKAYYKESSGLTVDDAVVIYASGSMEGIPLEYEFVQKKEGQRGVDWNLVQQSLIHENGKSYDVLLIKIAKTNEEKTYYFDITNFFGKF